MLPFYSSLLLMNTAYIKRKSFIMFLCLLAGIGVAASLPADVVETVPMVRAAGVINALVIGMAITLAGHVNWHPVFQCSVPSFLRGGVIAAIVHLDYVIYIWPDQGAFWIATASAAIFGSIVDASASKLFGEGKTLCEGVSR